MKALISPLPKLKRSMKARQHPTPPCHRIRYCQVGSQTESALSPEERRQRVAQRDEQGRMMITITRLILWSVSGFEVLRGQLQYGR